MIQRFKQFNKDSDIAVAFNNLVELDKFSNKDYESICSSDLDISESNSHIRKGYSFNDIMNSTDKKLVKIFHAAINESHDTLNTLLMKSIKEEEIINFLLKLDNITISKLNESIKLIEDITKLNISESISKVRDMETNEVVLNKVLEQYSQYKANKNEKI